MSEIKVNKISPRSGTTVTLGDSGDTFTIPAGATINNQGTATNFGATGAASWTTTVKTGDFTAVAGEGYFINTTSGEVTVTLPSSPSAGAVVAVKDYANTFDTNKVILNRNGEPIGGDANNSELTTEGLAVTLVYVDGTKGWLVTDDGLQSSAPGPKFVTATGGTIKTSGNFKTHIFTGPGTFCVSCAGNAQGTNSVDYFVVAGGGGSGGDRSGGGGAGGFRVSNSVGCVPAPTMSPSVAPNSPTPAALPVSVQGYPITVGSGGSGTSGNCAGKGNDSIFSTITSAGGGAGRPSNDGNLNGGSGAGAFNPGTGGAGNTPSVSPSQGNPGGNASGNAPHYGTGGGGGAGAAGGNGTGSAAAAGGAGSFVADAFIGGCAPSFGTPGPVSSTRYFAGGGSGGAYQTTGNTTSPAGGGGAGVAPAPGTGGNGTVNTGGGSGGGNTGPSTPGTGGSGGSGIVMIRYKFQ